MLIAQISDMHIKKPGELLYGRIDTQGYLERAVAHVNALDPSPDIALVTGDLVDGGKPEEYENLKRMLSALRMPFYLIPGNHDARDPLREVFSEHTYLPRSGFLQYVVEDLPLRLIALDTLVPGKGFGALCQERLDWLEARLKESDQPTLLYMHHPPFDCGIYAFDAARLNEGAERLADIVRARGTVERVLCGHVHRPIQVRWAGTMASIAPSTAHQGTLDMRPGAKLSMTMDPPGIALHLWRPATGLITHLSYVGSYEGPRPFS
ncbi:phosphodiesterase [Reyranella sp.]|uniref:phosphodiesterase n=1 Tax=Reyranella sp. TaxID=1929291 RepID=UPI00122A748E|nr:phosphodiesterase [Reyranella sp.]TAJ83361.1 MAG: phosphodiesterase [Reyranella sp.]